MEGSHDPVFTSQYTAEMQASSPYGPRVFVRRRLNNSIMSLMWRRLYYILDVDVHGSQRRWRGIPGCDHVCRLGELTVSVSKVLSGNYRMVPSQPRKV